jgi:hypothetical protein
MSSENWGLLLPSLGSESVSSTYPCLYAVPLLQVRIIGKFPIDLSARASSEA